MRTVGQYFLEEVTTKNMSIRQMNGGIKGVLSRKNCMSQSQEKHGLSAKRKTFREC